MYSLVSYCGKGLCYIAMIQINLTVGDATYQLHILLFNILFINTAQFELQIIIYIQHIDLGIAVSGLATPYSEH